MCRTVTKALAPLMCRIRRVLARRSRRAGTAARCSSGRHRVEEAGRVAEVAKGQAQQVASEIGTQARDLVGELKTQVRDQSVTQRDRLVDNLRRFGDDLDGMRQSSSSSGLAADLTGMLASKAREVSTFLSDHEPGDLIEEVRQFARQRHFLAGRRGGRRDRWAVDPGCGSEQ